MENLIPFKHSQLRKSIIRNDKSGQKLAQKLANRRKNKLAKKSRRLNLKRGKVAGRQ